MAEEPTSNASAAAADAIPPSRPDEPLQLAVELTDAERQRALLSQTGFVQPPGWRWVSAGLVLSVVVLLACLFRDADQLFRAMLCLAGGAIFVMVANFILSRARLRQMLRIWQGQYRLTILAEGLLLETAETHSRWAWSTVKGIQLRTDALTLHLAFFRQIDLPRRCFSDEASFLAWQTRLEQLTGLQATAEPPAVTWVPEQRGRAALCDLVSNLRAGVLFLLLQRSAVARVRASGLQVVLLTAVFLVLALVCDFVPADHSAGLLTSALNGQIYWQVLPTRLFGVLGMIAVAWAVGNCALRPRIVDAVVALCAIQIVATALALPLGLMSNWGAVFFQVVIVVISVWFWLACVVALVRVHELPAHQRLAAMLAMLLLSCASLVLAGQEMRMWYPGGGDEDQAFGENYRLRTNESVLYTQPQLLDDALEAIKPSKRGKPQLFLLALGGYGEQDVFLREVTSVEKLFAQRFGTADHSIVLVNNPATIEQRPMATTIALRESLADIGRKMNRDDDVLFLFMTSHGAQDHHFSLDLTPYTFGELTPEILRGMLDDAKIKNRVILVSACYSGGFIKPLANDNTLVMSASREDRNSHGCSHEADWTFFGRAYFDEALRKTRSFEDAFAQARTTVAAREQDEKLLASEPQIAVGSAIRPVLGRLEAAINKRDK